MRLVIIGFGLIGGSIARAVRGRTPVGDRWSIAAWSPSGRGPSVALEEGIVDLAPARIEDALAGADLVVIAAPPLACLEMLALLADRGPAALPTGTIVTDVASTKRAIVERATELRLPFVGGHPMAGSERSGFAAASADLFVGRPWIVTPSALAADEAIIAVERLARSCGAEPIRMDPAVHDRAVAGVSHLPLLLSAALVESVTAMSDWPHEARLAASGWSAMSRLAMGDPEMAAGIAVTNAGEIAARARALRAVLDRWIVDLEGERPPDAGELRTRFAAARDSLADERSDRG